MTEDKKYLTNEDTDKLYKLISRIDPENKVFSDSKKLYEIAKQYRESGNLTDYDKLYKEKEEEEQLSR